ncbi:hypothetical protein Bca52824_089817 [Brassica carinata]|uniref:RING-type domain-containing protein n=1 Tax=Brassica carinata TaxID=52824 RepID=A0A8X7NTU3_BRACI|nr:hypothetical protein Bca52824_089817 [Brassica carinata]
MAVRTQHASSFFFVNRSSSFISGPFTESRTLTREAEVSSLQARIQKVIASQCTAANQSTIGGDGEDAESVFVDPERIESIGTSCRICRRKQAVVMAFPCRHLVLCKGCDGGGAVRACPICLAVKSSGVEVLFS